MEATQLSQPQITSPAAYKWFARGVGLALLVAIFQVMFAFASVVPNYSFFNYWQYFTTQSNFLSAILILYRWSPFFRSDLKSRARYESLRAALVVFMSQTTFVYWAVLHGIFTMPNTLTFVSIAFLHSGAFVYFLIEYAVEPPQTLITLKSALWWLAYPLAYTAYIHLLAQLRPWYPYPFMDPAKTGSLAAAVVNQVVLAVIITTVVLAQRWLHNHWFTRRVRAAS